VPAPDPITLSTHRGVRVAGGRRGVSHTQLAGRARVWVRSRARAPHLSAYAWGAVGATSAFVALTCWWLTQDRSIPIYDAGDHLRFAYEYHNMLAAGNLLGPFTQPTIYPILGGIVGALAMFVGGVNVAAPVIGENLVFVPLLVLGCYQTGRLLFGRLAGCLAAVFALGSPLIISLFHVSMLDAPLTALVSVSVWLILASEDFSRPGVAALAGLAVGLGFNTKSAFPLYIAGLVLIVLIHGGWRNWRGFAGFCAVAVVIGAPWYIEHFSGLGASLAIGGESSPTTPGNTPSTLSSTNLFWYFWSVLNSQLLAPLFALVAGGALWLSVRVARERAREATRLEFLGGAFTAWLAVTLAPHHDVRYGLPLLAYLAVIGTGWIAYLPRAGRLAAIGLLACAVAANTAGITFGAGSEVKLTLAHVLPGDEQRPASLIVYSNSGFLASAPARDGDVPGLLGALYRDGVRSVAWSIEQSRLPDFSLEGLMPLIEIAKLTPAPTHTLEFSESGTEATLIHEPVSAHAPATCTRLSDGTGIWVVRYDVAASMLAFYCPTHRPRYYDLGTAG
jgi:hypothetical protein